MTFWEFLYNASFWQWVGLILLVSAIANVIAGTIILFKEKQ